MAELPVDNVPAMNGIILFDTVSEAVKDLDPFVWIPLIPNGPGKREMVSILQLTI